MGGKAQTILKDKADTLTEVRELKDATTMKNLTNQFEYWGEKADSPVYKEQARVKLERKAMLDEEVRAKAEKEIKAKVMRNNAAQLMKQQPGLVRQRTMKKEKSMLSPKSTLAGSLRLPDTPSNPRCLSGDDDDAMQEFINTF